MIEPLFDRIFLPHSFVSRVGKGTAAAFDRCRSLVRCHPISLLVPNLVPWLTSFRSSAPAASPASSAGTGATGSPTLHLRYAASTRWRSSGPDSSWAWSAFVRNPAPRVARIALSAKGQGTYLLTPLLGQNRPPVGGVAMG